MVEESKERKEKEIKKEKPTFWQRMKKPLAAGLLGIGLLLSHIEKAEAYRFDKATAPPSGEWAERIKKKYPEWWKYTIRSFMNLRLKKSASESINKSIEYFEKNVDLSKLDPKQKDIPIEDKGIDPDAFYLGLYNLYQSAIDKYEIEEVEKQLKDIIDLCSYNTKDYDVKMSLSILKFRTYYNTIKILLEAYEYDGDEAHYKKAIKYLNEALDKYNKEDKLLIEPEDRNWMEEKGPVNDIINIKNSLPPLSTKDKK